MKVRIGEAVLNDATFYDILDAIVFEFASGRHLWLVQDPDAIESSPWIQADTAGRAGRRNLSMMKKAYTDSIYTQTGSLAHTITVTIMPNPASDADLHPNDAVRCLRDRAIVFVENAESDGAFLDAMINALSRVTLFHAKAAGWWSVEQLGGFGEVEKRIAQDRERRRGPSRVFVIADSDSRYPSEETDTVRKVRGACTAHGVPYMLLSKRKMENYLPVEALQAAGRRRTFKAFVCLTEEQKDYFEMKGGFDVDAHGDAVVPPEQAHIFVHVHRHVLRALCNGFGKEVWRLFRDGAHHITEGALRGRCTRQPDEIDRLLDSVERLL